MTGGPFLLALAGTLMLAAGLWGIWEQARWRRLRRRRLGRTTQSRPGGLEGLLSRLEGTFAVAWLEREARRAGILTPGVHLFLGLLLGAAALAVLLYRLLPLGPGSAFSLSLLVVLIGTLRHFRARRQQLTRAFDDHLAEAARVLADSLRAGRSVYQALQDVPQKVRSPLVGRAFATLCRELELNASLAGAFSSLSSRIESRELRWLHTTLLTLRAVGGDMAGVMDQMAHRLVERAQTRQEVLAASRKGRGAAFMVTAMGFGFVLAVGALFPAVFAVFLTIPGAVLLAAYCLVQWGIWKLTAAVTHYDG